MSVDTQTTILLWALILPIIGALGVTALGRWPNLRDSWTVVIGISTFSCVARLVGPVMDGARPSLPLPGWMPGLGLGFEVEPLGLLFGLVASGLWILTSLYGFGYMRGHDEIHQTRFFTCFAVAIAAALGIAFAGDLEDAQKARDAGRFEEAAALFEKAVATDPASGDAAAGLTEVLAGLGRYDDAAAAASSGLAKNPAHLGLNLARART